MFIKQSLITFIALNKEESKIQNLNDSQQMAFDDISHINIEHQPLQVPKVNNIL